jgi:hypothetical protein
MDKHRADWFDNTLRDKPVDEQGDRIREAVADWEESGETYSYQEWEDMFEDRDPFEFL